MKCLLYIFFSIVFFHHFILAQQKEIDAIKKSGILVSLNDLQSIHYPLEADISEKNAAFFFNKAFALIGDSDFALLQKKMEESPFSEETQKEIARYIEENKDILEVVYKGTQMSYCRFPIDLTKGYYAVLPPLVKVRKGMFLLQGKAMIHIAKKETQEAVDTVLALFSYSRFISEVPVIICNMIGISIQANALSTLEILLSHASLSKSDLLRLSKSIQQTNKNTYLEKGLIGELCTGIQIFQLVEAGQYVQELGTEKLGLWWYKITGKFHKDYSFYLGSMHHTIQLVRRPIPVRIAGLPNLEKFFKEVEGYQISSLLLPNLHSFIQTDIQSYAKGEIALLALAIEAYRLEKNGLPEKLQDLDRTYFSDLPQDPYRKGDFVYNPKEASYKIYSFGPNQKDDNGISKKEAGSSNDWDIVFSVKH